jgi:hypothetical protein
VSGTEERTGADARLAELAEERARLWEEVQRLRAERREVEYYERRFEQMERSLSWRVTTPLRAGKTLAVKVRRRLRSET